MLETKIIKGAKIHVCLTLQKVVLVCQRSVSSVYAIASKDGEMFYFSVSHEMLKPLSILLLANQGDYIELIFRKGMTASVSYLSLLEVENCKNPLKSLQEDILAKPVSI